MRDSTIIYRSFYEAIKELPRENQSDVWEAIFEFAFNFKEIELQGINKTVFTLIKPLLKANIKNFVNGTKPKRKRKGSQIEANPKPNRSQIEGNKDKDKDKDVNVNVNKDVDKAEKILKKSIPILFKNSDVFDKEKLKESFLGSKYENADFEFYHESAQIWSDSGGNKKIDWVATIRGFMQRDFDEGKLRTAKIVKESVPIDYENPNDYFKV